jgi:hypothetical protein
MDWLASHPKTAGWLLGHGVAASHPRSGSPATCRVASGPLLRLGVAQATPDVAASHIWGGTRPPLGQGVSFSLSLSLVAFLFHTHTKSTLPLPPPKTSGASSESIEGNGEFETSSQAHPKPAQKVQWRRPSRSESPSTRSKKRKHFEWVWMRKGQRWPASHPWRWHGPPHGQGVAGEPPWVVAAPSHGLSNFNFFLNNLINILNQ